MNPGSNPARLSPGDVKNTAFYTSILIAVFLLVADVLFDYLWFNPDHRTLMATMLSLDNPHNQMIRGIYCSVVILGGIVAGRLLAQVLTQQRQTESLAEDLKTTLNSIGDAVLTTDPFGNIAGMNPVAEHLTGWSLNDACGRPLTDIFHIVNAHTRLPVVNPVEKVFESGKIVGLANHTVLIARNGNEYQIADSAAPIKDSEGRIIGVVLVFRDVTEDYLVQEKLRKSEEGMELALQGADLGTWDIDFKTGGVILNDRWAGIMGFRLDEIEHHIRIWKKYGHPEDIPHVEQAFRDHVKGLTESLQTEHRMRHKNGEWIWVLNKGKVIDRDENGRALRACGTYLDITARKKTEQTVIRERNFSNTVLNSLPGVFYLFDENGRYLRWNKNFETVSGYSPQEIPHLTPEDLFTEADKPRIREKIMDVMKLGSADIEISILSKYGTTTPYYLNGVLTYVDGRPCVLGMGIDISKRIIAEVEKARIEEQYLQSQKMESIGRMAGGVAHDLNNLLVPIIGYGEVLLSDTMDHDPRTEMIQEVVKAGMRARDLVKQLLAFSRKQILEYRLTDLNTVVTGMEKLLRRTIREDVEFNTVLSSAALPMMADPGQIEQVIMNLVVNALDAMPEGGSLTIETSEEKGFSAHLPSRHCVSLSVRDSGTGMIRDVKERIFDPFFSTKGEMGTGLGLATVYGIVKQHGGNILVDSEPGKGSAFRIHLPYSEDKGGQTKTHEKNAVSLDGAETILLAEDNEQVRNLTRDILLRMGYHVLTAANGPEALNILSSNRERDIHLLLTDVIMPGMNGPELFAKASSLLKGLKVLYMSGYTDNIIARSGVLDQGIPFIQKPFTVTALASKVKEVLGQRGSDSEAL